MDSSTREKALRDLRGELKSAREVQVPELNQGVSSIRFCSTLTIGEEKEGTHFFTGSKEVALGGLAVECQTKLCTAIARCILPA